jgi:hypothetical protein
MTGFLVAVTMVLSLGLQGLLGSLRPSQAIVDAGAGDGLFRPAAHGGDDVIAATVALATVMFGHKFHSFHADERSGGFGLIPHMGLLLNSFRRYE